MNRIIITALICTFFVLTSCHKKDKFNVYFFQNLDPEMHYELQLDGNSKGYIPYISTDPSCLDTAVQSNAMLWVLSSGRYKFKILNHTNTLIAEGKFKISPSKFSYSSSGKLATKTQNSDNCIVIRLGE